MIVDPKLWNCELASKRAIDKFVSLLALKAIFFFLKIGDNFGIWRQLLFLIVVAVPMVNILTEIWKMLDLPFICQSKLYNGTHGKSVFDYIVNPSLIWIELCMLIANLLMKLNKFTKISLMLQNALQVLSFTTNCKCWIIEMEYKFEK